MSGIIPSNSLRVAGGRLASFCSLHEEIVPPDARPELRCERIATVRANAVPFATGKLICCAGLVAWFAGRGADAALVGWFVMVLAASAFAWTRAGGRAAPGSKRSLRLLALRAALAAAVVALAPFILIPLARGAEPALIGGLTVGLFALGPAALYAVPGAVVLWTATVALMTAAAYALVGGAAYAPALAFAPVVAAGTVRIALGQSRRHALRFRHRLDLRHQAEALRQQAATLDEQRRAVAEQGETIAMLLREYDDGSAAWLWECDARGRLTRLPPALRALLPPGAGTSLAAFAGTVAPDARARVREQFESVFQRRTAFGSLAVPFCGPDGRPCVLRFDGKPRWDERGGFAGYRGIALDVSDLEAATGRARFLQRHDALTELPTRQTFRTLVDGWDAPFAWFAVNLSGFKLVNDTAGHAGGDALLRETAVRLRAAAAPHGALVARAGGDEFLVAVPLGGTDRPACTAQAFARTVAHALARPFDTGSGAASVGAVVGYALCPLDGAPAELPARADVALQQARGLGRGAVRRWDRDMDRLVRERRHIERELRGALERGELSLAFQPVVDMATGRTRGAEALLRWRHPKLGAVSPARFVPVAEEAGLIAEIGAWALEEACREAATWPAGISVAVNVSAVQMLRDGFADEVAEALRRSGLAPERLELELTETTLVRDADRALGAIARLRVMGCRVVLDDFGTGYSSLSYLRMFTFDRLKIDRSFVASLREERQDGRPSSAVLVAAIVQLAATLGLEVTAEGIEEDWQVADLAAMGCGRGQGYWYARPLPAADLRTLLKRGAAPGRGIEAKAA